MHYHSTDLPFRYKIFRNNSAELKELKAQLSQFLPFKPQNISLYKAAITHSSAAVAPSDIHNERLEFLGDAFLGSIVGEMLYIKYPKQDEGFLTEMRSKIVSRQNLNQLALNIGLNKIVRYNKGDIALRNSHIFGNALEALIGAIYLDRGFSTTKQFILNFLLKSHVDLEELENTETNFKKGLYQWAQKNQKTLDFKLLGEERIGRRRLFRVGVLVDGELWVEGTGWNKKEASQKAASNGLDRLSEMDTAE